MVGIDGARRMTSANTKLCTAIAKLEGWHHKPPRWATPDDKHWGTPPAYLTDAAETVRMFVALIVYYDESVDFSSNSMAGLDLTCERFKNPHVTFQSEETNAPIPVTKEKVMLAVAEAYRAMLEEKAK